MALDVEAELDRLYALPPDEFVPARNDLARRLRADGERVHAEEVARLRKPTAAVRLVNLLAREQQLDVQRIAKEGEALMHGKARARGAREDEQRTLARLAKAARAIAQREGIGAAAVDRATQTLRAAALSDDARELLRRGRLTEELEPPGLEALQALAASAPPAKGKRKASGKNAAQDRLRELRAQERELAAAARETEREARRAEEEAAGLRKRADATRKELGKIRTRIEEARR